MIVEPDECSRCKFYESLGDHMSHGECKKRAPAGLAPTGAAMWPTVFKGDWCGDYEEASGETP